MSDDRKNLDQLFSPEEADRLRKLLDSNPVETEESSSRPERAKPAKTRNGFPRWIMLVAAVVATVALAFGYVKFVDPLIQTNQAEAALNTKQEKSPIVASNTSMLSYKPDAKQAGEIPEGVNPKQLALGSGKTIDKSSVFIFKSKLANDKSHVMDVYMDLYSQRGRDFITLNRSTLEDQIETGNLVLRVHPVLNSSPFSIYAPEALAEVFGTAPNKAWGFFTDLMKESITLTGTEKSDSIVKFIAKIADDSGAKDVDAASIQNATFLTWLYTASNDSKLKVGYTPPVIYTDGVELDQNKWTINDPESMVKYFLSLS